MKNKYTAKNGISIALMTTALSFGLIGCGSDDSTQTDTNDTNVKVQTSADYATRSAANYADNKYGLVNGEYVASLITDWETNKPAGKRNLFVMEFGNIYGFTGTHQEVTADGNVTMGNGYIKGDASKGVYVFDRTSGCTSTGDARSDGVSSVPKPVFTIEQMDQAFATYGIDPNQDVLLLALGSPSQKSAGEYMAGVARMWYTLTYWGFPQESILVLNGQASHVLDPNVNTALAPLTRADIFAGLPSSNPTNPQWESISTIKVDGTILQATMKDMMDVIDANLSNNIILDARTAAEYAGTKQAKTEYKVCGPSGDEQCYTAFDGHMKNATNLLFSDVLTIDDATTDLNEDNVTDYKDSSMTFKPIDQLDNLFATAGYKSGDNVYTYCRTGTKASLLTFTSAAVLGYKTRMYDGSWIQWGKMANAIDTNSAELLPTDSTWRTDIAKYSDLVVYNTKGDDYVSPLNATLLDLNATSTDAIITEDKASK